MEMNEGKQEPKRRGRPVFDFIWQTGVGVVVALATLYLLNRFS